MPIVNFTDSGLTFGFEDCNCFRVELDPLVTNGTARSTQNNRACECVSVIDNRHCFIEAKQSAPKGPAGTAGDLKFNGKPLTLGWEVYNNYQKFLREIAKKFIDSFNILKAITEGRQGRERLANLPLPIKSLEIDRLRFILIVNFGNGSAGNVDIDGVSSLQDAIRSELRPFLKTWNIKDRNVRVVLPDAAMSCLQIPIVRIEQAANNVK